MKNAAVAGAAYFLIAFAAGFALGSVRVFVLAPRFGDLGAVLLELPVMLALSWFARGFLIRKFAVCASTPARALMGAIAFVLLLGAELMLGMAAFGRTIADQTAAAAEPAGLIGLAGQALFALFPLARMQTR